MTPDPTFVRNAADPKQVRRAERKQRRQEEMFVEAVKCVLGTAEGRLVMWTLLSRAGVFRSIWHPSAQIHYNAGRQDFGHELQADLVRADEELYETMEREMRAWQRREAAEAEAFHTPRAEETTGREGTGPR